MRRLSRACAGRLTAEGLDLRVEPVRPGVTTNEIDRLAFGFALGHGADPASFDDRGFPKPVCTSIDQVVCHGIPDGRPRKEGDIVDLDRALILDGWHPGLLAHARGRRGSEAGREVFTPSPAGRPRPPGR